MSAIVTRLPKIVLAPKFALRSRSEGTSTIEVIRIAETTLAGRTDRIRFTLMQVGLDHSSRGFTVFDTDLRLASCNRTYFELMELPFEMAKLGTPFADFMRSDALRAR